MKKINDVIYGFVLVDDLVQTLLDSPEMQRLRGIKQLSTTYLVYPGANHSRFEHSLGVYHLARELGSYLDLPPEFKVAALLHDFGHGPFSHTSENIATDLGFPSHTQSLAARLKEGNLAYIIERAGLDLKLVGDLINGRGTYGKFLSGPVDIDRLDYLARDMYYTTNFGRVDVRRIFGGVNADGTFDIGCVDALEELFSIRFKMYKFCYHHHTTRLASLMLERAIAEAISLGFSIKDIMNLDDIGLISLFRRSDNKLWKKLEQRKLYKIVLDIPHTKENCSQIFKLLELNFGPEVILDTVECSDWSELNVSIIGKRGGIKPLKAYLSEYDKEFFNRKGFYKLMVYSSPSRIVDVELLLRKYI